MLTEGQELWFVPNQRYLGQPRFVTVTKVGRVWAQISERGYRVDKTGLHVDGGGYSSPGRCYVSREIYEAETQKQEAWSKLRGLIEHKWTAPEGVSYADIITASDLLKISNNQLTGKARL